MEDVLEGFAKDEDVIDELDAPVDAVDQLFGHTIEMVSRTNIALGSFQKFKATHLMYHEGRINLVVFMEGALIVTFE